MTDTGSVTLECRWGCRWLSMGVDGLSLPLHFQWVYLNKNPFHSLYVTQTFSLKVIYV
jgi:hypothetical protein